MKYTIENIQNTGKKLKFVFFWGHQPNKDRSIGKSCFSQWWESGFVVDNVNYKTAEHYMMAEKARLFKDEETLKEILEVVHPHDVKKLGRKVKGFNPDIWNEHKYRIVYEGNLAKFSQNKELASFLLHTNDRIIVEASPLDKIWGIGMAENEENVENPNLWKGENLLGFALMEVRNQLSL